MSDGIIKIAKVGATVLAGVFALVIGEEVYNNFDTAVDSIGNNVTDAVDSILYKETDVTTRGKFGREKTETVKINRFTKNPK
jgi:hypothetical protein